MKTVEITEVSLADFAREEPKETWVLTRRGKPVAAVVPIRRGIDLETFGLSHNPEFIEIINRSWESYKKNGGLSVEQVREKYGLKSKGSHRAARRPR